MFRLTPGFIARVLLMPVAIGLCLTMSVTAFGQTGYSEREWTDNTGGFRIMAEFVKLDENNVILYRTDKGVKITVPLARLSRKDRLFLNDIIAKTRTGRLETTESKTVDGPAAGIVKPATPDSTEMNSILADQLNLSPPVEARIGDTSPGIDPPPQPDLENARPVEAQISDSTSAFPRPAAITNGSNPELSKTESTLPAIVPPEHSHPSLEMQPFAREDGGTPEMPEFDHPAVNSVDKKTDFVPNATVDLSALPMEQPVETIETIDPIPPIVIPFTRIPKNSQKADAGTSQPSEFMADSSSTTNLPVLSVEEEDRSQAWTKMEDESLAAMFQVSGSLAWKGNAHVTHLLDPVLPNYELVLAVRGTEILDAISNIGFVEIESIVDNDGVEQESVAIPPSVADPRKGWVSVKRGVANNRSVGESVQSVLVAVEFPRSDPVPESIKTAKGTLRIQLATRYATLTIDNLSEIKGLINSRAIRDRGLGIRINRPDDVTIVVEVTGNPRSVLDVGLVGGVNVGKNRMTTNRTHYYQFNFGAEIPPNLKLKVRMVAQAREISLPFVFGKMNFTAGM